jgi:tetratricopeptide (TPR) repeat protein
MYPAAVAVTALALGGLLLQELPARSNDAAVALANEGNWDGARSPALDAAGADPEIGTYPFDAALTEAHAGNHAAAAVLFRRVAIETDLPEAWLNLAAEDLAAGNEADVPASLKAALRLGRQRPAVSMASGELALRIGDHATALDSFVTTVLWAPSILADPWWRAEPERAAIVPAVIAQAMAVASPERRWEIALMSGAPSQAAALAPDGVTRDFIAAWGGDQGARDRLLGRCRAMPLDIPLLQLCARIEGRAGNVDRANELRYIADAQVGGAYSNGAELRVAEGPILGQSLQGFPAYFWGTYTYRRSTPFDILVPSLLHLTIE